MFVSVILPTYNEVENIVPMVKAVISQVPAAWDYEIIVVDDNSPDRTFVTVQETFQHNPKVIPVLRTADRGLAKSIRAGAQKARGDALIFMDTDFNHNPAEIPRMLHLLQVSNVVIGSRFCAGGAMEDVPHYLMSLFYNWFLRVILRTQIQDNLSGFLAIDRQSLEQLPHEVIFFGYGDYCFRLLHYAQRLGLRLLETPVQYHTRQKGKSKSVFWKLFFLYTKELFVLKMRANRLEVQGRPNPL
ncbi:MAG: glycosyltransferase [Terriglobia bacterium]